MSEKPAEQEVPAVDETVTAEPKNSLVEFLDKIGAIAPAIPTVVNAFVQSAETFNTASAGREAAAGNAEKAIENLVTATNTGDAEHNDRAEKILEAESVLNILRQQQLVSGAKLAESMKSDAVDDATFDILGSTAKSLRVQAVKLLESVLASQDDATRKEILSHLPSLTGARKSGGASSGTGTWRPYGRIFHVDGKVVPALSEGGKPNLAAATKVLNDAGVEVSADDLRNALGEKYGTESKSWADSQKADPLEFHGHKVWTTKDPTAGNKGATTAGDGTTK